MLPEKRFGMSGVARFRLYSWMTLPLIIGLVFGGDFYRPWSAIALVVLAIWNGIFDRVGPGGKEHFLGVRADNIARYVRSVFGKKIGN